jgi:dTDP-4-amino-4,6-dideoxygalactose transaminase
MSSLAIPFLDLRPTSDRELIDAAIRRVVDSGTFVLGPEVEAFEGEFAAASGASHAVAVNSGTDALMLLLRAAGIRAGDEVITTAFAPAFTANAIAMTGAVPVFVDVEAERAVLDPGRVTAALTSKTRAIVPVHLYGQPVNLEAIEALARTHNLALIEDCAQAHLATYEGRPVGNFGIGGVFSFYPTKNLGALGDGGAIVTNDATVADRVRRLRNGGQSERNHHVEPGVNSRLDELQAAILRARLTRLAAWTEERRRLAGIYFESLDPTVVSLPAMDTGHVYHLFVVRSVERDALRSHLSSLGVGTLVHYPTPVPKQPAFRTATSAGCPNAERLSAQVVSLPLHPNLSQQQVLRVSAAVNAFRHTELN